MAHADIIKYFRQGRTKITSKNQRLVITQVQGQVLFSAAELDDLVYAIRYHAQKLRHELGVSK